jgi:hypothetical protein
LIGEKELVVDLDVKRDNNGIREFERLQGCRPEELIAPRVRTRTGGIHLTFDPNGHQYQNTRNTIAPGIDTRATGVGYVVLPSGGNGYRWETSPTTPKPLAPEWTEPAFRREIDIGSPANARSYQGPTTFGCAVLARAYERIENAPDNEQEATLSLECLKLGHYIAGGTLDYEPTLAGALEAGL